MLFKVMVIFFYRMAYIVRDEDTSMASGVNFKSFLISSEDPNLMAPPANSFSFVKRNLLSEIHRFLFFLVSSFNFVIFL